VRRRRNFPVGQTALRRIGVRLAARPRLTASVLGSAKMIVVRAVCAASLLAFAAALATTAHDGIASNAGLLCGVERWSVKTLQDRPHLLPVQTTTVAHLTSLPPPAALPYRRLPFERHVFRVVAAIILVRPESDGDAHLVLSARRRAHDRGSTPARLHRGSNTDPTKEDDDGSTRGAALPPRCRHGSRVLGLLPRPDRSGAERG
jgi:hypothetical protein